MKCRLKNYLFDLIKVRFLNIKCVFISYPKTGSTICRMRQVAYLNNFEFINHNIVNRFSSEIGRGVSKFGFEILKTHQLHFLPFINSNFYIMNIRDPEEVICSFYSYKQRRDDFNLDFNVFVQSAAGLPRYRDFLELAIKKKDDKNWLIINYEKYVEDPLYYHKIINKKIKTKNSKEKWCKVLEITSRENISKSESKNDLMVNNFSKKKNYSNLKIQLDNKSLKLIQEIRLLYNYL